MTDYVVAVGFQTDAGAVKREVDQLADAVDKGGLSAGRAEKLTQKLAVQQQRLAEATAKVERYQKNGLTTMASYQAAIAKQAKAQQQLAKTIAEAEAAQQRALNRTRDRSSGSARLAAAAGGAIAGISIGKIISDSVSEYGRLNAAIVESRSLFGGYANDVDAFGKSAGESFGLSRTAVLEEASSLGELFKTLRIGQQDSADMSVALVQLSSDLASLNHTDPSSVFDALKGALTGQFDTLKQYNVVLDAASVKQEAVRLGLVQGKDALTGAAQAQAVYSLLTQQTSDAQGAFANSGDLVTKSQRQMQSELSKAKAELGRGLTPLMLDAANAARAAAPVVHAFAEALGFIGSHETTRKLVELAATMYLIKQAVDLGRLGVEKATLWYGRLTVAATEAAAAEAAAAKAGRRTVTPPPTPTPTPGVGAGPIAVTTGVTLATVAQGPEQKIVNDGQKRGGFLGGVESTIGQVAQFSNGVTTLERAWDAFKVKDEHAAQTLSDTAHIDHFSTALERARAKVDALTDRQRRINRSIRYAQLAQKDSRALAELALSEPVAGLLDALPTAPHVDLAGDSRKVGSARRATTLAEDRLNALKATGKATTVQLEAAENRLASARERLAAATSKLNSDQGKANADKSLSLQDVLDRSTANSQRAVNEARNVRRFVQAGLSADVINDLKALETSAPGTVARVAKSLTPVFVAQLNHDAAARRKAMQDLAVSDRAADLADARRRGIENAKAGDAAFMAQWLADLKDPTWRALLQTELAQALTLGGGGVPEIPGRKAKTPAPGTPSLDTILGLGQPPTTPTQHGVPRLESLQALPTRPASTGTVTLDETSVAKVAMHLSRMAPRQTTFHVTAEPNDFDGFMREMQNREALSNLGSGQSVWQGTYVPPRHRNT